MDELFKILEKSIEPVKLIVFEVKINPFETIRIKKINKGMLGFIKECYGISEEELEECFKDVATVMKDCNIKFNNMIKERRLNKIIKEVNENVS